MKMNKYFLGNKISNYGIENGYVDYATLAKSFDCVLNNKIFEKVEDFDLISGSFYYDDDEEEMKDVYQWYIIDRYGADILERYTDEIVFYSCDLDLYLWGVTHFGTGWDCVLTDIKID